MDIKITPSILRGEVRVPSSKSIAHRAIICAGLSRGVSTLSGISMSKDIEATLGAIKALGADYKLISLENRIEIRGIETVPNEALIDCCESGSTLRFFIPIVAALGVKTTFIGKGKLPSRPITPYIRELSKKGINFEYSGTMPFTMSGKVDCGDFSLEGDISSQFITGLLFALPLLDGDSTITLTTPLQSKPYADMTVSILNEFGICEEYSDEKYCVKGNQYYNCKNYEIEGDYSQAAFFMVANALGCEISLNGMKNSHLQGDEKIVEILSQIGYNRDSCLDSFSIDAGDIPDLVPILAVLGCFCKEQCTIYNAERLRIKESDRLLAVSTLLNNLGGDVRVTDDGLIINHVKSLKGGTVDSFNDHRIAMAASIAACKCTEDVIIKNAGAIDKSYPEFYQHYIKIGGKINVINF